MDEIQLINIFEENVVIHPNMNSLIKKEFNSSRIQDLIRKDSFYGEALDSDMILARSVSDLNMIQDRTSAIQILSLKEDGESLKVTFKFLENNFAQEVKQTYIENPQSYKIRARAFTDSGQMTFFLVTFDLIPNFPFRTVGTVTRTEKGFSLRAIDYAMKETERNDN